MTYYVLSGTLDPTHSLNTCAGYECNGCECTKRKIQFWTLKPVHYYVYYVLTQLKIFLIDT